MSEKLPMVCPVCGKQYTLGVDGVFDKCDKCKRITRNSQGMIIYGLPGDDEAIKHYLKMES